jgi:NO-binding membrane sensor protein with MHYT domain
LLAANNFSFGLLTPVLGYIMSCLGAFIGLRCTTRAFAYEGAARARWLVLAAISIGATACWVMHFIAMLGYTIPGMTIRYNIPVTIGSMLIAVAVVGIGLFIVGFRTPTWQNLAIAGVFTGIGVSSMHYTGMLAMEMPASMTYEPALVAVSVLIGIVAATAALWAALRLRTLASTLVASAIFGAGVSGLHYTGMEAMQMHAMSGPVSTSGATAEGFLLPLIIGIGIVSIIMTALLVFSPNEAEIREDRELKMRIDAATARLTGTAPIPQTAPPPQAGPAARWNTSTPYRTAPGPESSGEYGGQPGGNGQAGPGAARPAGHNLSLPHRRPAQPQRPGDAERRLPPALAGARPGGPADKAGLPQWPRA